MKNLLQITLSLLIFVSCQNSNKSGINAGMQPALPESQGMSAERLARIDSMLIQSIESGIIPGAVALVARNGKIVYHKAFGMADNQSGRVMQPNDIFRIASQTKAVTATAVMMLWEEGRFRLDDPIARYIPEFRNPTLIKTFNSADTTYTTEPARGDITIRQLLTHTAGVGYGFIDGERTLRMIYHKAGIIDAFTADNFVLADNIKKLGGLPLSFNPGERYKYSEGLDIMGYLIEIMSGMPLDKFFKTRIFDPLGMSDTWFYLPDEKSSRLVSVQEPADGAWKRSETKLFDPDYPIKGAKSYFSGGAGLSSTVEDYAKFLQMYLNGGAFNGKRLLSRTTIDAIMSNQNHLVWNESADLYYGLAFGVLTERGAAKGGRGSQGTFSWEGYFNTSYFADPKEKVIGLLFKQTMNQRGDQSEWKFRLLVGQAIND